MRDHLMSNIPDAQARYWHHAHYGTNPIELEALDDYWKFCFVRNPWERIYSFYKLYLQRSLSLKPPWSKFDDFISELEKPPKHFPQNPEFRFNQLDHLLDRTGELSVDFIGRYENRHQDLPKVMRRIGVTFNNFPHVNQAEGQVYTEAYTSTTKARIANLCAKDIEYFGYSFEGN